MFSRVRIEAVSVSAAAAAQVPAGIDSRSSSRGSDMLFWYSCASVLGITLGLKIRVLQVLNFFIYVSHVLTHAHARAPTNMIELIMINNIVSMFANTLLAMDIDAIHYNSSTLFDSILT